MKKYTIKIPNHILVIYSAKKKIITFKGSLGTKSLKLNSQLFLIKSKNKIKITQLPYYKISKNREKKIVISQGTTTALIKQFMVDVSYTFYQKLKIVGVGYRAFTVNEYKDKLLMLKLGYSHFLYFKIPNKIKIVSLKMTKLFIYGNSYQNVTQTSAFLKSYKKPEPYKGKGILYNTEKIELKEGKKI